MHAVSSNQIIDVLHFNDKDAYKYTSFQMTATGLEPTTTYFVNEHSTI